MRPLGLYLGFSRPGGGGGAPAPSGTTDTRYSVAGTGFRWPTVGASHATNTYFVIEFRFATPAYAITDPRVFCSSHYDTASSTETYLAGGASIIVQGWSIETSPGVWTACDGAAEAGVATVTNADGGKWLPRVAATLSANTGYVARMTFQVSATSVTIPRMAEQALATSPLGQEKITGGTATQLALLTNGASITNSGANGIFYKPSMMIAKGGDGRPALIVVGDSIGYGSAHSRVSPAWAARNEFGYVTVGLDSATGAKRIAYHNMSIPGQRAVGTNGWETAANWAGKRNALQQVFDAYGAWPFDEVLCQHITNSVPLAGSLRTGFDNFYDLLALWGKPITQIECLAAVTSGDGYATVAGQTPQTGYTFGSVDAGHSWPFNADVGGASGLGDAAAYYRASGKIIGSIAPWRYGSADTTTNRDKWPVRPFSTTLAAAYVAGATSISTVASPTVGQMITVQLDGGAYGTSRDVTAVSGAGPYTVTLNGSLHASTAAAAGNTVREVWGDNIHPSGLVHRDVLAQSIIDWKVARGWV